jgi:magnesium chelatase accessory protein
VAQAPDWSVEGRDWPDRQASRFVEAGGLRWHVQVQGRGPVLLLLHGTGAATHSWRDIAPRLAERATVVAPDLPGHGFSGALPRERCSLPGFAEALQALMQALGLSVFAVAGHSAGAAIAAQLALQPGSTVQRLAWLNPALRPFDGWSGVLFGPLARWMAQRPPVARLAAWRAGDPQAVRRLIAGTGSSLDARGVALYQRLVARPAHVAGVLAMMAGWDLAPLWAALPSLAQPVTLVIGERDRAVPPRQADEVVARLRSAPVELHRLAGLGHLAHEEAPSQVGALLEAALIPV